MSVSQSSQEMDHYPKYKNIGVAHIFNNTYFQGLKTQRRGAERDVYGLTKLLKKLGYKTTPHTDLRLSEFNEILDDIAESDLSNESSLIMVFASHGDGSHFLLSDGRYFIDDIFNKFRGHNCPMLLNRPKVFIFQACRGLRCEVRVQQTEHVVHETDTEPLSGEGSCNETMPDVVCEDGVGIKSLPAGSDFLICNSSCQGYASYRDVKKGSWYIQTLIDVFRQYFEGRLPDHYDITCLLTIVSKQVAEMEGLTEWGKNMRNDTRLDTVTGDDLLLKQMPAFTSSLTKLFFLPQQPSPTLRGQGGITKNPINENKIPEKKEKVEVHFN